MRKRLFPILSGVILCTIFGLPLAAVTLAFQLARDLGEKFAVSLLSPVLATILFVVLAGTLSLPFQRYIIPGKFPRDLNHPVYFGRRVYGLCWTSLYYCTPVYFLCLSVTPLKWITFRLFGYRGSMNFAIYPDTWIRDLPLVHFGDGAYLSNKATVGTNIALSNGFIRVDQITLEQGAYLGHLGLLAPGAHLGACAEVGVGCGIGIKTRIGEKVKIGPFAFVEHGAGIGAGACIGSMSYVGTKTKLADNLVVPPACLIPARRVVDEQWKIDKFISSLSDNPAFLRVPVLKMDVIS